MAVDTTSDDDAAKKFLKEKRIAFPSLKGNWEIARERFGVNGTPTNLLVDQKGRVLFTHTGFPGPEGIEQLEAEIEAMLSRP